MNVAVETNSMHGNLMSEARYLRTFGTSPERAIPTLTTDATRTSGIEDRVGHLDPGYAVDAVFVANHPLNAPDTLAQPTGVIKRGDLT